MEANLDQSTLLQTKVQIDDDLEASHNLQGVDSDTNEEVLPAEVEMDDGDEEDDDNEEDQGEHDDDDDEPEIAETLAEPSMIEEVEGADDLAEESAAGGAEEMQTIKGPNKKACDKIAKDVKAFQAKQKGFGGASFYFQQGSLEPVSGAAGTLKKGGADAMKPDSLMEIASLTKTMTAALTLSKIFTDESLSLKTTLKEVMGEDLPAKCLVIQGKDVTDQITIEQVLQHTTGLPDYWADGPHMKVKQWYKKLGKTAPKKHKRWRAYKNKKANRYFFLTVYERFFDGKANELKIWTPQEILAMIPSYTPPQKNPSEKGFEGAYIDTGFMILGLMIEKWCKKPFNDAIREDLFLPVLGRMPVDTMMRYDTVKMIDRAAKGTELHSRLSHRYIKNGELNKMYDATFTDTKNFKAGELLTETFKTGDWGAGGLITSATEMGEFFGKLMRSKTSPWKEVAENWLTHKPAVKLFWGMCPYGYGVQRVEATVGHGGHGGSEILYDPISDFVYYGNCQQ
jgi:CubicO group peptidase (beta-lactamase class C family)